MKNNQNGFSILVLIFAAVIVGIIGCVGWYVYANNYSVTSPKETSDRNKKVKFDIARISLEYPETWKIVDNKAGASNGYIKLEAPDGFTWGLNAAPKSFFDTGTRDYKVERTIGKVLPINAMVGDMILSPDGGTGKYCCVGTNKDGLKDGDIIDSAKPTYSNLLNNPNVPDIYVSANGGYPQSIYTLDEMLSKQSVKDLQQILKSMKYY